MQDAVDAFDVGSRILGVETANVPDDGAISDAQILRFT